MQETIKNISREVKIEILDCNENTALFIRILMNHADFADDLQILISQTYRKVVESTTGQITTNFTTRTNVDDLARNLIETHMDNLPNRIQRTALDRIDDRMQNAINQELLRNLPINQVIHDEIRRATTTIFQQELAANSEFQNS